jgi:predicted AAA+ superfamily ATPase
MAFPGKKYVNLENIDLRSYAREDPRGFLGDLPDGGIIDEIQRVPDILSYIQPIVDEKNRNGLFILTGSGQFEMMDSISQSLAGRTALLKLLPFDMDEAYGKDNAINLNSILYTGFYPRIFKNHLNPTEALSFYFDTYIQKDVRTLVNVKDIHIFEKFVRLCAGRTGQLLNLASLGNDLGVSHNTVKSWLSILEASYIVTFLKPYYSNINKRLLKTPKLYFLDVGLAVFLQGFDKPGYLSNNPQRGALFESLVVAEFLKHRFNNGKTDNLFFYRDRSGNEVDIVLSFGDKLFGVEIKSSVTFHDDFLKGLRFIKRLLAEKIKGCGVVYGGDLNQRRGDVQIVGFKDIPQLLEIIEHDQEISVT